MGEKEWEPEDVFEVFGDALARRILVLASERPLAAEELAEHLDASLPTIYRRVNALLEYDLVAERQEIDEAGNHYKTFETTLKRVTFEVGAGGYDVDIQMRRSLIDQFEAFWADLEDAGAPGDRDPDDARDRPDAEGWSPHG